MLILIINLAAALQTDYHWDEKPAYFDLIRDDMSDIFGEEHLSTQFKEKMRQCMVKWENEEDSGKMPAAMDGYWKSFVALSHQIRGVTPADRDKPHPDYWVDCNATPDDHECLHYDGWLEGRDWTGHARPGNGTDREYFAFEICNVASNQAYARAAMQVCDFPEWHVDVSWRRALKRAFFALSFGSSFMHASHTHVGHTFDVDSVGVLTYIAY